MIDTEPYLKALISALAGTFGCRLVYVGLQGSYLRGEADENSDFDVMLVIDGLSPDDLDAYREILVSLGHYDHSCGFVCGKEELACWNPLEVCHLLNTTRDVYGELAPLMPECTRDDVAAFVKQSVGNLFHELCHRYIHRPKERSIAALPGTYKQVFFILQNLHWLRSGEFVMTKREMLEVLDGEDRAVLEASMTLKKAREYDFEHYYGLLFRWCRRKLQEV